MRLEGGERTLHQTPSADEQWSAGDGGVGSTS